MEKLLGWLFLSIIFFIILLWIKKFPDTKKFLLIAFLLRSLFLISDQYGLINLPDSGQDTKKFNLAAIEFSNDYGLWIVFDFFETDSLLISRIISIFFTIFAESEMMARTFSVALGTACVFLVYRLCLLLWDYRAATRAAWLTAIFPTLILYSSLVLREVYIVFFLLLSLISITKFMRKKTLILFLKIILYFFIIMLFHGPMIIGCFVFLFYLIIALFVEQLEKLNRFKINIFSLFFLVASSILLILFISNKISIPYIGTFQNVYNLDIIIPKVNSYIIGDASYPSWLIINNNLDFFSKISLKIFYFLYSPFIWDVKSDYQMIGLLDGSMYFILTLYVFRNWRIIWENPITRIFIFIFITYIIIYGISIGNFGTGIRHRSKFVVILIVLAAPRIHKLIFSFKKKLYKK